ncbi:MAG TPA: hypothetical protein DDW65_08860 [Firmicutes bacterium]|nr:hypothetical protein [Bacillota bacterium]
MKKIWASLIMVGLLMGLITLTITNRSVMKTGYDQPGVAVKSKAQLVMELNRTLAMIRGLENTLGRTGPQGYKVYAPQETGQLLKGYQELTLLVDYLNRGVWKTDDLNQWEGYPLVSGANKPYHYAQVFKSMNDLIAEKVPFKFIAHLKIYLLPDVIPGVSGLGGSGYILLSAQDLKADLIGNQLPVTLYHEIGHHVNFTFMAKDNGRGEKLWAQFLRIRGGTWHGPGSVNTKAWGESSEETFAEDFRMLFGKDQPYFGDLALGDPRVDPHNGTKEKQFIRALAAEKDQTRYCSPWIPEGDLLFWQNQGPLLMGGWLFLSLLILSVRIMHSIEGQHRRPSSRQAVRLII